MSRFRSSWWCVLATAIVAVGTAHAAEQITLKNGFDLICDHRAVDGAKVRLYMDRAGASYLEVAAADIVADEHVDLPQPAAARAAAVTVPSAPEKLTDRDLQPMLAKAGTAYDIDADLLASVVRAESAGHSRAVSRAGAQGLMQLMPGTASELGVDDTFVPSENIEGGSAYLDSLLKRYHENLKLALAAYNAGPAAVERWHGIPPYRETRLYVARVIREYNRRYALRHQAELRAAAAR